MRESVVCVLCRPCEQPAEAGEGGDGGLKCRRLLGSTRSGKAPRMTKHGAALTNTEVEAGWCAVLLLTNRAPSMRGPPGTCGSGVGLGLRDWLRWLRRDRVTASRHRMRRARETRCAAAEKGQQGKQAWVSPHTHQQPTAAHTDQGDADTNLPGSAPDLHSA